MHVYIYIRTYTRNTCTEKEYRSPPQPPEVQESAQIGSRRFQVPSASSSFGGSSNGSGLYVQLGESFF